MKKKKLLASILAVAAIIVFVPFADTVEAEENENLSFQYIMPTDGAVDVVRYISEEEMAEFSKVAAKNQEMLDTEVTDRVITWADSQANVPYNNYYRSQMTEAQQRLYDEIIEQCNKLLVSNNDLTGAKSFSDGTKYYPFSRISCNGLTASEAGDVFTAAYYSNPQFYFLIQTVVSGTSVGLCADYDCGTAANRNMFQSEIDKITDTWMSEINMLSSEREKEWLIARKLCDQITYNLNAPHNQSMLGALVDEECVCNGYTMAATYFFNLAGIESFGVRSDSHAWNIAKIDGIWYEVDTTWLDGKVRLQGTTKTIDFYNTIWLNGSRDSFLKNDNNKSHVLQRPHTLKGALLVPQCTVDMTEGCEHDNEHGLLFIGKVPPCKSGGGFVHQYCAKCYKMTERIYFEGHNTIYKFNNTEHWLECNFDCGYKGSTEAHKFKNGICSVCGFESTSQGDINNDGYVDSTDLLLLRSRLSDITLGYDSNFDINGDGYADNTDLLILRNILSKLTV